MSKHTLKRRSAVTSAPSHFKAVKSLCDTWHIQLDDVYFEHDLIVYEFATAEDLLFFTLKIGQPSDV